MTIKLYGRPHNYYQTEMNTPDNPMKPDEIWKDVVGYEGYYQVSNYGAVRSLDRLNKSGKRFKGRLVTQSNCNGYCRVGFTIGYGGKHLLVHRLVAIAFIANPENKLQVNHIDNNRSNNHHENLEWCTPKENVVHAIKLGVFAYSINERNGTSKFTNEQVRNIKKRLLQGVSGASLALEFNVTRDTIMNIKMGRTWKGV